MVQIAMRQTVTSGTGRVVQHAGRDGLRQVRLGRESRAPAHGWFVCFAPMEKPTIVVACIVEHGRHGATSAAPVCRAILDVYFGKKKPEQIGSGQGAGEGRLGD